MAILTAAVTFWSCIDIPTTGPPESAFDMRAQIRFVHVASGTDTIAIALGTSGDTAHTSSATQFTTVSGTDTIIVTDSAYVTYYPITFYRRFQVDFSSPLDVIEDGVSVGQLSFGGATSYLDVPAGPRDLSLRGMAQLADTLEISVDDTRHVIRQDTVGKGSSRSDTVITNRSYAFLPVSAGLPPENITVDYKNPKIVIFTDRKATVLFIHDLQPIIAQEGNRVRYGWINYQIADERYSDRIFRGAPSVPAESIAVRFINASRNTPSKRLTIKGTAGSGPNAVTINVMSDSVAFLTVMPYRKYHEGQYSFYLSNAGSTVPADSLPSLSLTSHHRYSFVAVDSASTFRLRRYDDD
ncbi:MAG: DUF4397 domain-containing protein [Ignavibacteriae bacterium]|nr:DUF4397 domain-containing protein [Ignavibacteriota bacterium]